MKTVTIFSVVFLITILFPAPFLLAQSSSAESAGPDEALVSAYLEKKAPGDTGSCMTENMNMQILDISDVVPGQQAEVFYKFEYKLRCNRGSESKSGQGVLRAARFKPDGGKTLRAGLAAQGRDLLGHQVVSFTNKDHDVNLSCIVIFHHTRRGTS